MLKGWSPRRDHQKRGLYSDKVRYLMTVVLMSKLPLGHFPSASADRPSLEFSLSTYYLYSISIDYVWFCFGFGKKLVKSRGEEEEEKTNSTTVDLHHCELECVWKKKCRRPYFRAFLTATDGLNRRHSNTSRPSKMGVVKRGWSPLGESGEQQLFLASIKVEPPSFFFLF